MMAGRVAVSAARRHALYRRPLRHKCRYIRFGQGRLHPGVSTLAIDVINGGTVFTGELDTSTRDWSTRGSLYHNPRQRVVQNDAWRRG